MLLPTLILAACARSEPGSRPDAPSPVASSTSTPDGTCAGTDVPAGQMVDVGGYPECREPTSLADFCAGRPDWVAAFGGACPSRDALVGALEAGTLTPLPGYDYGCAVSWSCAAGATRIVLETGYFDAGFEEAWFDAAGAMTGYAVAAGAGTGWCCDGTSAWRSWVGEPQASAGCADETTLGCGGRDCYCAYYGTTTWDSGGAGGSGSR